MQGPLPYGYPPPPGTPPPKKPFKFEMWMLGALIVPIGITIAIVDVVKTNSADIGEECVNAGRCKDGLQCVSSKCMKSCSLAGKSGCPSGYSCKKIKVTLQNQAGFHDLGEQPYCSK